MALSTVLADDLAVVASRSVPPNSTRFGVAPLGLSVVLTDRLSVCISKSLQATTGGIRPGLLLCGIDAGAALRADFTRYIAELSVSHMEIRWGSPPGASGEDGADGAGETGEDVVAGEGVVLVEG